MAKKDLKERLVNREVKSPNKLIGWAVFTAFKHIAKKRNVTFEYNLDYKKYRKKQIILLSTHATREEYLYTLGGFNKYDIHCVIGYQNYFQKYVYGLLIKLGTIPKYLYQADMYATKQMLKVIKNGESLALFPEGIQSTSGSTHPINPATIKLLVKCRLPIVLCTSRGAYLSHPRFSNKRRNGKITFSYQLLLEEEDYDKYSEEEIYNIILENFKYNEFEYNRKARIAYKGECENIEGLDKIIYICPHCNSEFNFSINGKNMKCNHCGYEVTMNEYYDLLPVQKDLVFDDIDKWYKWQRKQVNKQVKQKGFEIKAKVKALDINLQKLKNSLDEVGTGELAITNHFVTYKGLYKGEQTELVFDIKGMPSMPFCPSDGSVEFYYNNNYYSFAPLENSLQVVKWMLAVEEIHNSYNEDWKKVSDDVYGN